MRRATLATAAFALALTAGLAGAQTSHASIAYSNAYSILSTLDAYGALCANATVVPHPNGYLSMIECSSTGGYRDTVIAVFSGPDVQARAAAYAAEPDASGTAPFSVAGLNWVVRTVPGFGFYVQDVLGGQVVG